MMRKTFLATAASVAFIGLTLPVLAADDAKPAPSTPTAPAAALSQALLQAQVDKCLADGSITVEKVHAMADKDLIAALDTCSKVAAASTAEVAKPSPAVEQHAAAPAANEPGVPVAHLHKVAKPEVTSGVHPSPKTGPKLRAAPAPAPLRARLDAIVGGEQTGGVAAARANSRENGVSPNGHFSNFWEQGEPARPANVNVSENRGTSMSSRIRAAVREFVR